MTIKMTAAQSAQQKNRSGAGQYQAKLNAEAAGLGANQDKTSQDLVLAASVGKSEDSYDDFFAANPDVPYGKARELLHKYSDHVAKHPRSVHWPETLAADLEKAGRPEPELTIMAPGSGDAMTDLNWAVLRAIENPEEAEQIRHEANAVMAHLSPEESDALLSDLVSRVNLPREDWNEALLGALRTNADAAGHSFDHTYQPPRVAHTEGYAQGGARAGEHYTGFRDVTEVNKLARAEFKKAQKAGWIPRGMKISVTGDKGSMTQAMNIEITGAGPEGLYHEEAERQGQMNATGRELNRRLETIGKAWNRSDSDAQSDYFDETYYCSVELPRPAWR